MDLNWQSLLTLACRDHSRRLVETNNPRGESAPLNMMPHPSDFYLFVPATPWGQTPVLEANGQTVTQSIAITRYLGRQAGLCGADAWEDMRIDEIVYVINDLRAELAKYHYEKDEKRKEEVKGTVLSTTAPFYLSRLDAHVKANNGYLANGKLCIGSNGAVCTSASWSIAASSNMQIAVDSCDLSLSTANPYDVVVCEDVLDCHMDCQSLHLILIMTCSA
ncbi:hypothetical protein J6590_092630 [Homalodisca vitripennis]|nr:hypothetical protein J6590_092630 [Homalodisca vitripennis]